MMKHKRNGILNVSACGQNCRQSIDRSRRHGQGRTRQHQHGVAEIARVHSKRYRISDSGEKLGIDMEIRGR